MDTHQINSLLRKYNLFKGTFPRDMIPSPESRPAAFIVNTDSSREDGEHWVALIVTKRNRCIYFDPFGFPPLHRDIINFIKREAPEGLFYSSMSLQNISSDVCGKYCVYFVERLARGDSLRTFLIKFSSNTFENDSYINDVV